MYHHHNISTRRKLSETKMDCFTGLFIVFGEMCYGVEMHWRHELCLWASVACFGWVENRVFTVDRKTVICTLRISRATSRPYSKQTGVRLSREASCMNICVEPLLDIRLDCLNALVDNSALHVLTAVLSYEGAACFYCFVCCLLA